MSSGNNTAISFDDLVASNEEWKGHDKVRVIIGGMAGILSTMSSSLLIFIIARSRDCLRTTYHRLVLGMSISDILYSASYMTFQAMQPADVSYWYWNASGNQGTCSAVGFIIFAGVTASQFYCCSLNLNYLAVVKWNCSDAYIRFRIEPFLHAFPIALALTFSIVPLFGNNYNGGGLSCHGSPVYEPPHCIGFEDGQVREGFKIPCGRGRDGFVMFYYISISIMLLIPPAIVGVSLGMMYKKVHTQERRRARYGAGALSLNAPGETNGAAAEGEDGAEGGRGGIGRTILQTHISARIFGRRAATNVEQPISRAVMQRAAAYSLSFFLTWSWGIILAIPVAAQGGIPDPIPVWFNALAYMVVIFQPLQGFFNLIVYMQPKVTNARRSRGQELSWPRAIGRAFRMSLGLGRRDGSVPPSANARSGDDSRRRGHRAPPVEEEREEVAAPGEEAAVRPAPAEEEKADVQENNEYPGEALGASKEFLYARVVTGSNKD